MKQTILMVILTLVGTLGAFVVEPFVGVAMYYLFGVLRPQYIWRWALPEGIAWSEFVAWATILATLWSVMTSAPPTNEEGHPARRFSGAHKAFFVFSIWIAFTFLTALNRDVAWPWFLEYLKIFLMFMIAALVIRNVRQLWCLYLIITGTLIYIAYELNFLYFTATRVDIYRNGYGGLDNNGAGLMIAMGIPLAIHAWEGSTRMWRWIYLAGVPLLLHAVLMSYSRGAMVSLIVAAPLLIIRSRRKRQFTLVFIAILAMVPFLAGKEIRARFFTLEQDQADASANSRFDSWEAAFRIANEHPLTGVGVRNSTLMSHQFGADFEGRVIHSQYLQTLADAGYPGLALYLLTLGSTWIAIRRTRRALKTAEGPHVGLARSMLSGIEGALCVFVVGATFLSLEVFELPYILVLLAAQTSLLLRIRTVKAPQEVVVRPAGFPVVQPRVS